MRHYFYYLFQFDILFNSFKSSSDIIDASTTEYLSTFTADSNVVTSAAFSEASSETSNVSPGPSQTSLDSVQTTSKVLVDSSSFENVEATSIQPSPGYSLILTSSISLTTQLYNITVQATYEGNCSALESNGTKNEFFDQVEEKLKEIFSPSNVVVHRDNYKCGSVIFNYTVQTQFKENSFRTKLEEAKTINITVNGLTFTSK